MEAHYWTVGVFFLTSDDSSLYISWYTHTGLFTYFAKPQNYQTDLGTKIGTVLAALNQYEEVQKYKKSSKNLHICCFTLWHKC